MRIKHIGTALIAIFAMSAVVAVAAAHEFNASGMGALSVTRNQKQNFKTKFGNVECPTVKVDAEAVLHSESQHATVLYSGCTAFGVPATISAALYLFLASGLVHITNTILIKATGCHLLVLPQLDWTVKFANTGKELELKPEVVGIAYEGTGAICSGSGTDGTYTGTSVIALSGQTVEWK